MVRNRSTPNLDRNDEAKFVSRIVQEGEMSSFLKILKSACLTIVQKHTVAHVPRTRPGQTFPRTKPILKLSANPSHPLPLHLVSSTLMPLQNPLRIQHILPILPVTIVLSIIFLILFLATPLLL